MGDIPIGIYVYRWYTFDGLDRKSMPNLERWYTKLQDREAFQKVVMVGLG
jgi:glutathione S-transferase